MSVVGERKEKTEYKLQRAFPQSKKRKGWGLSLQKRLKWKSNMLVPEESPSKMERGNRRKESIKWKTKWNGISFPACHKNRIPRTKDTNILDWYLHPKSSERECVLRCRTEAKVFPALKVFVSVNGSISLQCLSVRFFFPANTDKTASLFFFKTI